MDIAIAQGSDYEFDLTFRLGDFKADEGLETAVLISLLTDRRCEPEELPDPETDRRGWWGDLFADVEADQIGSKLWLLDRTKQSQETLNAAQEYAEDSLEWLLEDGVAASVTVETSF